MMNNTICIKSKKLADKLIIMEYPLIRIERNRYNPNLDVWIFRYSKSLINELEKWKAIKR